MKTTIRLTSGDDIEVEQPEYEAILEAFEHALRERESLQLTMGASSIAIHPDHVVFIRK